MNDVNLGVHTGRLTTNPTYKSTDNGAGILKFSIASNQSFKTGMEWKTITSFFDVTCFGRLAANLQGKLVKGRRVLVEGEWRQDRWEDAQGAKHARLNIIASKVEVIDAPNQAAIQAEVKEAAQGFNDDVPW